MAMPPIYKPNAANKGSAFTFNFGPAKKGGDLKGDLVLYVSTVLQATWNASTKQGSFKENAKNPAKTCNVKLSLFEVGGLINAIKRRIEFKGYHTFPGGNGSVQFSFTPATKDEVFQGFRFSILRSSDKAVFAIGIGPHEAEVLNSYLDFGLKTAFQNKFRTQFAGATQQAAPAPKPEPAASEDPEGNPFEAEGTAAPEEPDAPAASANDEVDANPFG
jgi:hypothetical protein